MPTLRDLGEIEVIRRLTAARAATPGVVVGPGDDAAVLRPEAEHDLVATTDAFVEGRHWQPDWIGPTALGARLATANLSDLAAMAAAPRWALLSIGARPEHSFESLLEFQLGLERALASFGAAVVGGNVAAVEGPEWFSLTLLGETARARAWTRTGARAGDRLAVTGSPGRAGAGARLAGTHGDAARSGVWAPLIQAWSAPGARVELARSLAVGDSVHAAIDVSDGLAGDLKRLSEASRVGAIIEQGALPADPLLDQAAAALDVDPLELRFGASDDYELLLAIAPERRAEAAETARAAGVPLAFIGEFAGAPGSLVLRDRQGHTGALPGSGYDHFGPAGPATAG